jgi:hypothetical protein
VREAKVKLKWTVEPKKKKTQMKQREVGYKFWHLKCKSGSLETPVKELVKYKIDFVAV